jgi:hypothetical protein
LFHTHHANSDGHGQRLEVFAQSNKHPGGHRSGQRVQQIMRFSQNNCKKNCQSKSNWEILRSKLTSLDVEETDEGGHETSNRHRTHQLVSTVVGGQGEGALAQVSQALSNAHHEQVVGVLCVVLSQLTQHCCQSANHNIMWSVEKHHNKNMKMRQMFRAILLYVNAILFLVRKMKYCPLILHRDWHQISVFLLSRNSHLALFVPAPTRPMAKMAL